jgi:hypothetical protein
MDQADPSGVFDSTRHMSGPCDLVDRQIFPSQGVVGRCDNHPVRGTYKRLRGSYTERSCGRRG